MTEFAKKSPESLGISSNAIVDFIDDIESKGLEMHGFILMRHDCIASEFWWKPYKKDMPHMLFSLSKSFTSTAVGMVVDDGLVDVEDSVISYFGDNLPEVVSDNLEAMKVKHLLSMNTGHVEDTAGFLRNGDPRPWATIFLDQPVKKVPGTHFLYNTGATYMLSAIVQKVTGKTVNDFLEERLYKPLDIKHPFWESCPQGINYGGWGLNATTEDISKLAQLYLHRGVWEGKRLLSEEWINIATSYISDNSSMDDPDWSQGYGYQFWMCRHNAYRGDGAFGQFCIVLPEKDATIAITSGVSDLQGVLNSVWDKLLPNMGDVLPEDGKAVKALENKINGLEYTLTSIMQKSNPSEYDGSYIIDDNEIKVEKAEFSFGVEKTEMTLTIAGNKSKATLGIDKFIQGRFMTVSGASTEKVVGGGTWLDNNTYSVTLKYIESPFTITINCEFKANDVKITPTVNVSFGDDMQIVLKGSR